MCWIVLLALLLAAPSHVFAAGASVEAPAATYTWVGAVIADWQSPTNWSPPRTNPKMDDILVFRSTTNTIQNVPNEGIGRLIVSDGAVIRFQSSSSAMLIISGHQGSGLEIGVGSALHLEGENRITIHLEPGTTADISGNLTFSAVTSASHQLTGHDPDSILFNNGAVFTAANGFTGHPFGSEHLNSVVFSAGSTYICQAGGDPFGAPEPASVVVFQPGSVFSLRGDVLPEFSGRVYADFEVNYAPREFTATGSSRLNIDNLTVLAGKLRFNLTGDPGHAIRGNILTAAGTQLHFGSGTVRLNGPSRQTIRIMGGLGVGGGSSMVIDNPGGIVLERPFSAWNLILLNGVITTSPFYSFDVSGGITRVNGYVNGYLRRILLVPGEYRYDVGSENGYSPVTVLVANGTPAAVTVKAIQSAQPNLVDSTRALSRYWEVYEQGEINGTLTFAYVDSDVPATANEDQFIIQRYDGSSFFQPVGTVNTVANTFTVTNVTEFSRDWTLAEPIAVGGASPTPTPSPFPELDLTVGQSAPFTVGAGADLVYTVTATILPTALGGSASPVVRFNYPTGVQTAFVGASGTNGYTAAADSTGVSFSGGVISTSGTNPGTATLTVVVRPLAPGVLTSEGSNVVIDPGNLILETNEANNSAQTITTTVVRSAPLFDYDGDGRTDISVFRPASGVWYLNRSTAGFEGLQFGADGDKLTPADFDGDGKTDIAVYRPSAGQWYVLNSASGTVTYPVFGVAEDIPAPGDYDGDGKADLTVFRPSQGTWYRQNSSNGTFFGFQFGATGDVPTVGDFDGDGKNDLGIFRPSVGDWYNIRSSNGSVFGERFGQAGDKIAPADYDGDGKTDIAIFRPSTGLWVVRNSATATYSYHVFGAPSDIPISGDYDGDGKADIGVWRPADGTWYVQRSSNGSFLVFPWGQNGDRPTPAAYGN
jgi:hypothetical protein